jgi:hypothetical protein
MEKHCDNKDYFEVSGHRGLQRGGFILKGFGIKNGLGQSGNPYYQSMKS